MNKAHTENATATGALPLSSEIRLFSWNVNGLRAVLRKGALQQFLKDHQPDILCLQEIKCKPDQLDLFEADALKDYQIFWNPADRPGYSGTAILVREAAFCSVACDSKTSFELNKENSRVSRLGATFCSVACPIPQTPAVQTTTFTKRVRGDVVGERETECCGLDDCESRTRTRTELEAANCEGRVLALDFGSFYLVNVYTPNSKPDLSRLKLRHDSWDPEFKDLLKNLEKTKPVITCGDFNCAHQEIDLARPAQNHHNAGFTDEEREGLTNLISAGFLDTFRTLHPTAERYTWWSHWGKARENNVGWRIDYFFISSSLKSHLKAAEIYEAQTGSDHCPISITMEF